MFATDEYPSIGEDVPLVLGDEVHYIATRGRVKFALDETGVRMGGLGAWRFDNKTRKRKYVDLTGRELVGHEAFLQSCRDREQEQSNRTLRARDELRTAMVSVNTSVQLDASSPVSDERLCTLSCWGVPPQLCAKYAQKGITRLFPWQVECLTKNCGAPLRGGNLIYSAPTSGGKTLVAEILMLRRLALKPRGCVLFVVPFIALAEEKCRWLREMWSDIPLGVRAFHGESLGCGVTPDLDVGVCTIERANIILSQLVEAGEENLLSMVVVDELHMLVDRSRGFLLEVLLSKLKFLLGTDVQVVGMSATLPQMEDLATWLDASMYTTTFRPVSLGVFVSKGGLLYTRRGQTGDVPPMGETTEGSLTFDSVFELVDCSKAPMPSSSVGNSVTSLCLETLNKGKSVIIFCPSKRLCEEMAMQVAAAVAASAPLAYSSNEQHLPPPPPHHTSTQPSLATRRVLVLEELRQSPSSLCPTLKVTVPRGVAYHHAGLSVDERNVIQLAFAAGTLSVLCATSTLAAGVSLPANRVIINTPRMGHDLLRVESFRQMCGRAGRMGLDSDGEAILVIDGAASKEEERAAIMLMTRPQSPLLSELHLAQGGGLEKLLLELCLIVSRDEVETTPGTKMQKQLGCRETQLRAFVACTLLAVQQSAQDVERWTKDAMVFLYRHNFLTRIDGNATSAGALLDCAVFVPTAFSRATVLSGLAPADAVEALWPLQSACRRLILGQSNLHLVSLATPPHNSLAIPWDRFAEIFRQVCEQCPNVPVVAQLLGIDQGRLERYRFAPPVRGCTLPTTRHDRRFFLTLVLLTLTLEWPVVKIEQLFGVSRGQFSILQTEAAHFCKSAVLFCAELRWPHLAAALGTMATRLSYGVREELLPLVRMGPDMPGPRARTFLRAGLATPRAIVEAGLQRVGQVLEASMPYQGTGGLLRASAAESEESGRSGRQAACAHLALRILRRAIQYLGEELELQRDIAISQSSLGNSAGKP